ncbi:MAG: allantoinase AllB [Ignavibacteriaceae bacterium]
MPNKKSKILKNVFLSTKNNKLKLVDVYFSDKIEKIVDKYSPEIEWGEINSVEKRIYFANQITKIKYPSDSKIYDGEFQLLVPGGIDSHVHFDTPGFEDRDDFDHGSSAAAFGGVTTVIDMPCTSLPPVTNKNNFEVKLNALTNRSLVDFAFYGGVCGNDFDNNLNIESQIQDLSDKGVAGFKTYLISGMNTFTDLDEKRIMKVAKWIEKTGKPMAVHAEDKKLIVERRTAFKNEGQNNWQSYCSARDDQVEAKAIKLLIDIAEKTECRIHVVHLSSKLGFDLIRETQSKGLKITSETCPHYLYFTQEDFNNQKISAFLKTAPPVKNKIDSEALWEGLQDGTLAFVVTDHAGCDPEKEKSSKNFWEVYGGIPGVEHRVPFLFSEGFLKNRLTLSQTIKLLSSNVADYFNLKNKGFIKEGYDADFALINLWDKRLVKFSDMHSKGKYTPFEGVTFNSVVEKTFLRGELIMNRSGKTEQNIGYGRFIKVGA